MDIPIGESVIPGKPMSMRYRKLVIWTQKLSLMLLKGKKVILVFLLVVKRGNPLREKNVKSKRTCVVGAADVSGVVGPGASTQVCVPMINLTLTQHRKKCARKSG